ncbi:YhcN/YlaJ family sporulation lipoprotein [Cytobacillus kochii]|uniref:YhcN/YlaJ family sporulation lipoprotein n=1 Tax=Cytobacillus kochii TaxID=859143 RepID=UPI001CD26435|nr:YhcN/YlaJ family sporulation lipoprotein [Cytobacillus kochii]MCA1027501.1 YhcN/YlaJ family sporulation lipoprotein [Cytobacillus kochii]
MPKYLLLLISLFLITGCSKHDSNEAPLSLIKATNPTPSLIHSESRSTDEDMLQSIEKDIEKQKELYDAAIVKNDDTVLIAYKVRHLQRFHMKKIEKDVKGKLEDKYPDVKFIVSSDFKIFLEVVELHEQMKNPNFSAKKAEKKFEKIVKLKKELT